MLYSFIYLFIYSFIVQIVNMRKQACMQIEKIMYIYIYVYEKN